MSYKLDIIDGVWILTSITEEEVKEAKRKEDEMKFKKAKTAVKIDKYKIEEELCELTKDIMCEVCVSDTEILIETWWGDWKHTHLRLQWLVGEYLDSKGIKYSHTENVTEEDGSDCYSAYHVWKFRKEN